MSHSLIIKANGKPQRFSSLKFKNSLTHSGVKNEHIDPILIKVKNALKPEITSQEIFNIAHHELNQNNRALSYRYALKRGIFELGPTGFPFEQLMSRLWMKLGYQSKTNQMVEGKCVTHEVDLVGETEDELIWGECKFHNVQGTTVDLKTALYVYARFLDLKENATNDSRKKTMWLITNTRFTKEAIAFSECRGVKLLGWEYPSPLGLNQLLETHQLYPITSIHSLKRKQKLDLMQKGIITCSDFQAMQTRAKKIIPERKLKSLSQDFKRLHEIE